MSQNTFIATSLENCTSIPKSISTLPPPISVNWHVWSRCNYHCRFCFGRFKEISTPLDQKDAQRISYILSEARTRKLTFAGGEPTLCPYLGELLSSSKRLGLTTMVLSNGTGFSQAFLDKYAWAIDWVALSIESASEATERALGRGWGNHVTQVVETANRLKTQNIRLKVNTVVTSVNWQEDLSELLTTLQPERWKVFQVLPILGQNHNQIKPLLVSKKQFLAFVKRHEALKPIVEDNKLMLGSYLMLDALGRFFQNTTGRYVYSRSILGVSVEQAIKEVGWNYSKFIVRNGIYAW